MAKDKKDKKTKAAEKKARTAAKNEKAAQKHQKKSATKAKKNADSDDESEADLDALLASYAKQQEQFLAVTEQVVPQPPSARANATLLANPANVNELLLFGGEHYNGGLARFFNDLFVYNIPRDEWRLITSPNSPLPRSGHAWTRGGNQASTVWLFGGEFSSPKQGTFYHYGDFWCLNSSQAKEWTKIETKGKDKGPSSRSGHRMTYFKQYIILYGGFQDTSSTTKYLNDLWLYDTTNYQWYNPPLPPASPKPDARSSFTLLPHETGAVMFGGYSRVKATNTKGSQKGGPKTATTYLKPVVHQDAWFLRITPPPSEKANSAVPPVVRWERRKKPSNIPQPPRAGATMAFHKGRGIQFGGVHDVEEDEEGIESEFFNNLGVWNIARNSYFNLALRKPRQQKREPVESKSGAGGRGGRGKKDEEDLLANLRALELRAAEARGEKSEATLLPELQQSEDKEDEKEEIKVEKPVIFELPHPRFNAQLTVQDDVLYIFGGTFEKGDREFTFDELWSVDLGKLDGSREIFRRELEDWQGEESSDDEEDDEEDEEEEDEDELDEEETSNVDLNEKPTHLKLSDLATPDESVSSPTATDLDSLADTEITEPEKDPFPHPRPFESLRDFYARTANTWQGVILDEASRGASQFAERKDIKEIRKDAFERAEQKWWECREEIQALEDEQEESGIQEVVNLAEKAAAGGSGGTVGRRR